MTEDPIHDQAPKVVGHLREQGIALHQSGLNGLGDLLLDAATIIDHLLAEVAEQ